MATIRPILCCLLVVASFQSKADWLDQFEANCRAKGGTPVHNPGGGGYCAMTGSGASKGAIGIPSAPIATDLMNWLLDLDNQQADAARRKRSQLMQALESERLGALRRQEAARASDIAAIQRRLMASDLGLKASDDDALELKTGAGDTEARAREYGLPGRHIFRNDIFTGQRGTDDPDLQPGSQWGRQELTLKLGKDATESLRERAALSAPTRPASLPSEAEDLARRVAELTPQQRRELLARLSPAATERLDPAPKIDAARQSPEQGSDARSRGAKAAAPPADAMTPGIQAPANADLGLLFGDILPAPPAPADPATQLLFRDIVPPSNDSLAGLRPAPWDVAIERAVLAQGDVAGGDYRYTLIAHFAPELTSGYGSDLALTARIDALIDKRVAEARRSRAAADTAAWNNATESVGVLARRFTPAGQTPDTHALLRNADFVKARDRILQSFERAQRENAEAAEVQLRRNLELAFGALRN